MSKMVTALRIKATGEFGLVHLEDQSARNDIKKTLRCKKCLQFRGGRMNKNQRIVVYAAPSSTMHPCERVNLIISRALCRKVKGTVVVTMECDDGKLSDMVSDTQCLGYWSGKVFHNLFKALN